MSTRKVRGYRPKSRTAFILPRFLLFNRTCFFEAHKLRRCAPKVCNAMTISHPTRLFTLRKNLYADNAPIVITSGELVADIESDKVYAILKIKNISEKHVVSVKISFTAFDAVGCPIGDKLLFEYTGLNAKKGASFGQKTPVSLPRKARVFSVSVDEVIFSDGSIFSCTDAWTPL